MAITWALLIVLPTF